jgi:hypothetical protein
VAIQTIHISTPTLFWQIFGAMLAQIAYASHRKAVEHPATPVALAIVTLENVRAQEKLHHMFIPYGSRSCLLCNTLFNSY